MNTIINLYKPSGMSSQQAVTRVKRILSVKKAGHTGTLDPLACGVLLVCLGEATKVSRFLINMDKRYRARVKLGQRTDTGDAEGRIIGEEDISGVTAAAIRRTVAGFKGRIIQTPPMYSAVKVGGETLYRLARKGLEVERPSRLVEIYEIEVTEIDLPFFEIRVSCSKGTYIRSLCDDIGKQLGTGAYLAALERTGIGFFDVGDSVTFEELQRGFHGEFKKKACSEIDEALAGLSELVLNEEDSVRARNGMPIPVSLLQPAVPQGVFVRLKSPAGRLFGIGRRADDLIRIERILNF